MTIRTVITKLYTESVMINLTVRTHKDFLRYWLDAPYTLARVPTRHYQESKCKKQLRHTAADMWSVVHFPRMRINTSDGGSSRPLWLPAASPK